MRQEKNLPVAFLIPIIFIFLTLFSCKKEGPNKSNAYYKNAVGEASHDLLASNDFNKLTVEILYSDGFGPTEKAKVELISFLENYLNKPSGIELVTTLIPSTGAGTFSVEAIKDLEDKNRTRFNDGKNLTACLLFLDGEYAENSGSGKVLGIAYRSTSMCIFQKTIQDLSGGLGQPDRSKAETTVINHELGHILGLVNLGCPMVNPHQDNANGHHCENKNCLMFWSVENGEFLTNLLGTSPVPSLDSNCLSDLKNNGGK